MIKRIHFILLCLLTSNILAACGPSQAELDAEATQISANIFATQTAEAPTWTPTATSTSTPLPTDTLVPPTDTPTPTNTPLPPTSTPTNTPLPPTPTPTSTSTPTNTPLPPTPTPSPTPAPPTATPTSLPTPTPALGIGSTRLRELDGATIVYVPAGEFLMGTDAETVIAQCEKIKISRGWVCRPELFEDAEPVHAVNLDAFYIDKYEVTNGQYNLCAAAGVCTGGNPEPAWSNYPVTFVQWAQAQRYCQWVGAQIPTEAQWEYAARGTEGTFYPWGNTFESSKANTKGTDDGYEHDAPVGSFPTGASWVGAQDLTGNIAEWVDDWYDGYPDTTHEGHDFGTTHKVIRGGAWSTPREYVGAADRSFNVPEASYNWLGFRCVQSP